MAVSKLELWADLLFLSVGNPKTSIEIQRPLYPVITTERMMDVSSLDRWADLFSSLSGLSAEKQKRVRPAMW